MRLARQCAGPANRDPPPREKESFLCFFPLYVTDLGCGPSEYRKIEFVKKESSRTTEPE